MPPQFFDTSIERSAIDRETDKAFCIRLHTGVTNFGGSSTVWVPKSQARWIARGIYHESLHVPAWFASRHQLPTSGAPVEAA